jgi:hypothetical protein
MMKKLMVAIFAMSVAAATAWAQDPGQINPSTTERTVDQQIKGLQSGMTMQTKEAPAPPAQTESLGTLARKLKKEEAKEGAKPAKVYTNDNIPKAAEIGPGSASGEAASTPAAAASGKAAATTTGAAAGHGEQYFRSKANDIRAQLSLHQRELAVLQQKLSQNQLENYSDPQKTLEQTSTPTFYSDQQKLKDEIAKMQAQIDADNKAMDDLRTELQRANGDPGWIR